MHQMHPVTKCTITLNLQHQMQKFHQRLGGDSEEEEEQKEEEGEEEGMLMEEKLCGGHYVKRM